VNLISKMFFGYPGGKTSYSIGGISALSLTNSVLMRFPFGQKRSMKGSVL
jgi:hypothetical protein